MNEIAWKIINGLCTACGFGFFLTFFFGDEKKIIPIAIIAVCTVLLALLIGKLLFM